jgi:predicted nucleic acid-binding protein
VTGRVRLFLDANVLFTAAHSPEGRSAAIFELARAGVCQLATSPHALEEARRNLRLKSPKAVAAFEALVTLATIVPEAAAKDVAWAEEQGLPLKDAPILAVAVSAGCDVLVTGDKSHFGHFYGRRFRGALVSSPADALARLLEK